MGGVHGEEEVKVWLENGGMRTEGLRDDFWVGCVGRGRLRAGWRTGHEDLKVKEWFVGGVHWEGEVKDWLENGGMGT